MGLPAFIGADETLEILVLLKDRRTWPQLAPSLVPQPLPKQSMGLVSTRYYNLGDNSITEH